VNAPQISLYEVYARNDVAREVVAGFAGEWPALAVYWQQIETALADVPTLGAVIGRLTAELADTRMDRANLLAAMRATLGAQADGEADPLYYLRDELAARHSAAEGPS
jgi:hypothetical protein